MGRVSLRSQSEYRHMFKNLLQVWRRNRGNWLFIIAVVTVALASVLWRFDLLPQIQLEPSTPYNDGLLRGRPQPVRLVFTLLGGKELGGEELGQSPVKGFVQILKPSRQPSGNRDSIKTVAFELSPDGVTAVFIDDLPAGTYAPLIYLDLNENGELDRDEKGQAIEPSRTIETTRFSPNVTIPEKNMIQLSVASETNIVAEF